MAYTIQVVKELITRGNVLPRKDSDSSHHIVFVDGTPSRPQALVIKYGHDVWKTEALAMQLVSKHTNVPVPKFFAYLTEALSDGSRRGYIVMEKVPGVILGEVIDKLGNPAVRTVMDQLKTYMNELHRLDGQGWGLTGKGGMYHRKHFSYAPGPVRLTSTKDFINYFACQAGSPLTKDSSKALQGIDLNRPPVFSHGDLLPENIMYDVTSGKITSIIDWECAGCYPYFWNAYVASKRDEYSSSPSTNWETIYTTALGRYPKEVEIFGYYYIYASLNGSFVISDKCACCQ